MANRWTSRKFWMAVVGALLLVANEGLGLNIPEDTVTAFAGLLIAWILGEAHVDAQRARRGE